MTTIPAVLHRSARAITLDEFLDALRATCTPRFQHIREQVPRPVALAISGGVDSMALAHLCATVQKEKAKIGGVMISDNPLSSFRAFVVDHGLREGSSQEARSVAGAIAKHTHPVKPHLLRLRWDEVIPSDVHPSTLPNVETLARRLRYRRLGTVAHKWLMTSIFTAHHEDDQYETVMMRLLLGHGYRGLQGMRRATDIPECHDLHLVNRSGFVDDQLQKNPFHNNIPTSTQRKGIRREMREEADHAALTREMAVSIRPLDDHLAFLDAYYGGAGGSKRAPPLAPLDMEDGGISIFRPLLHFSKDRLIATCVENGIPWFEDPTNADQTMTIRNSVRHMVKHHELPTALQKPALLDLSARCRARVAAEEAETRRMFKLVVMHNFETATGTVLVELPQFSLPTVPARCSSPVARRQKRLDRYRLVAARMIRKLLAMVTPEQDITQEAQLGHLVSMLFPSLTGEDALKTVEPKPYVICGVQFTPLLGTQPLRWMLARAPYVSNVPRPRLVRAWMPLPEGWEEPAEFYKRAKWHEWELYDGRYWVRTKNSFPVKIIVAPFEAEHQKPFRESLADDNVRDRLSRLLKVHAPSKVRYTLPAIYAQADLHLIALPTLGVQLPGVEDWLTWEFRYRKVDVSPLRLDWRRRSSHGGHGPRGRTARRRRQYLRPFP
ncbi:hypothetical protein B0T26DRAFT_742564 [Lasiosphaeria miniovina]|uniref:tRNA(Ile)-lysidine synthetase n=1 Tax=Lasiosphaeria miniovina TaxID=1954250 RepID=A0AA40DMA5_9PEZI|nr:uncharacterized protein B0T26DRAFT_742564 [Lasiosphaeria miniovina]KAK0708949.1 hypothetical protein B0T26DRAFT_742564 [Lasiosphaeria miniovina]